MNTNNRFYRPCWVCVALCVFGFVKNVVGSCRVCSLLVASRSVRFVSVNKWRKKLVRSQLLSVWEKENHNGNALLMIVTPL